MKSYERGDGRKRRRPMRQWRGRQCNMWGTNAMRLALFSLVSLPCLAQQALTWTVAPAIRQNTTFSVTISITQNSAPAAFEVTLTIPPNTSLQSATAKGPAVTAGKGARCGPIAVASTLTCIVWGFNEGTISTDGQVLQLNFQTANPAGQLPFSMVSAVASNMDGTNSPIQTPGPIGILVIARCDLNGDGAVTTVDAGLISTQIVNSSPRLTCDLNSDGVCDVRDLALVVTAGQPGAACTATSYSHG